MSQETMTELITVVIDGFEVSVPKGTLVIRAAEQLGIQIPRFCDHPLLDPAGACRQCLVEIEINGRAFPKPQASCTIPVEPNMIVKTQLTSAVSDKAQKGIMELLLINHPLDCPVCDKGGECPLQNQAMSNGRSESRFPGYKRTFEKPVNISAQVLLDRERCVLCARCTRFSNQIAGDPFITLNERGALQQVGIYEQDPFNSYFSGNTVQICPVGALTGSSYRFRARPFDLVSTDSACEHCAAGCALRTDVRRGKTLRRLAGIDANVNEEWNCDKGRWAFRYLSSAERITTPLVRGADGELHEASWPEAITAAANGLRGVRAAVLAGGRLTQEDAYAYAKFARIALGTNDIDFRARVHSEEEAAFLAAAAVFANVSYRDLDQADQVVLVDLEPEDEAPILFLRLYKQVRKRGLKISTNAPFTTRGSAKLKAVRFHELSEISDLTERSVILVGERAAEVSGRLSAVLKLTSTTPAKLAWVPRRAGERGALNAGAIGNLLPGGRPVADSAARVDVATAWGVDSLPSKVGLDTAGILQALASNQDGGLAAAVIAGVDPADIAPGAINSLLGKFIVSLEISHSSVTAVADVVLPVAAVTEKSGSYVDWQGSARSFEPAIENALVRSDLRILSILSDALGAPINLTSARSAREELASLAAWDGAKVAAPDVTANPVAASAGNLLLHSHRQLIDLGSLQQGEDNLAATARASVAVISAAKAGSLGVNNGDLLKIENDFGSITLPAAIEDIEDSKIWIARNSLESQPLVTLGAASQSLVTVVKA
jgi:NADH-quinone oxidoreductase subunit G